MAGVPEHGEHGEGTSVMLEQALLDSAVTHLVGQSRSWMLLVEGYLAELEASRDPRAFRVVEALGMTLAEPARPGTLRHLEQAATELLRSLRDLRDVVVPESPE